MKVDLTYTLTKEKISSWTTGVAFDVSHISDLDTRCASKVKIIGVEPRGLRYRKSC